MARQNSGLELIASENFVSLAVLEAAGTVLTNKYAEGYPGRRYYGGCEYVDVAESLAIARAKALFGAEHANVQPHSGAQANMAVYLATLKPGDTILGMNLAHGGHLTHGHPLNFSGKLYTIVPYGVRAGGRAHRLRRGRAAGPRAQAEAGRDRRLGAIRATIDFARIAAVGRRGRGAGHGRHGPHRRPGRGRPAPEPGAALRLRHDDHAQDAARAARRPGAVPGASTRRSSTRRVFPGVQGGPLMHVIAAKAVCFKEAAEPAFTTYQQQIVANARRWPQALAGQGFRLVSGGTDNHLMLVDVFSKGLTGKVAEAALGQAGITVNKNAIPFDKNPPMVASGIRIGTPAVTTRGMREAEMDRVAALFARALAAPDDAAALAAVKADVEALCAEFPLYPDRPRTSPTGPAASLTAAALMSLGARVDAIFAPTGRWPQTLVAFEPRDGQRRMAAAVADTLEDGGVLLVEAGTGTGKTLAYLVPAILSGQRVVVSTGTKNLQEQIFTKDLPLLARVLPVSFTRHAA